MKKLQIEAIDAETGELMWDHTGGTLAHVTPPDLFINGEKVWTLDPALKADGDCDARLLGSGLSDGRNNDKLPPEEHHARPPSSLLPQQGHGEVLPDGRGGHRVHRL